MILPENEFRELFLKAGIETDLRQYKKLEKYSNLLLEWNEKFNLTALTSPEDISEKHFLDSVLPFYLFGIKKGAEIIDIGSGAGFPSCPLKIFRNDIKITLLDSLNKRITFLNELSDSLSLEAECFHARAEDAARLDDFRERFDIATARAVAALPVLCEYCLPFVKVGGYFLALKGGNISEEIDKSANAVKTLGGKIDRVLEYTLPNGDKRALAAIKKISHTPAKYPRNKGQMTKKPL